MKIQSVRFWTWENGSPVKLTVSTDGTPIRFEGFARHDEGWSAWGSEFYYDRDSGRLVRESFSDGTDCDGRLSRENRSECPLHRLTARWLGHCYRCARDVSFTRGDGIPRCPDCNGADELRWTERYPDWRPVDSSQRDYAAEAMGY